MGTRGLWGFKKQVLHNDYYHKVTYNHMDSYPSWLGSKVVRFVQETDTETLRQICDKIILVDQDFPANQEQIDECKQFANSGVDDGKWDNWYVLLRETQGCPELYRDTDLRYMINGFALLSDLMCEYAYIINVSDEVLEVRVPDYAQDLIVVAMKIKFETIRGETTQETVDRISEYLALRYGCPLIKYSECNPFAEVSFPASLKNLNIVTDDATY